MYQTDRFRVFWREGVGSGDERRWVSSGLSAELQGRRGIVF